MLFDATGLMCAAAALVLFCFASEACSAFRASMGRGGCVSVNRRGAMWGLYTCLKWEMVIFTSMNTGSAEGRTKAECRTEQPA